MTTTDFFITIHSFRGLLRACEIRGALQRLRGPELPPVGVNAYYQAENDVALMRLRFDAAGLRASHVSTLVVWASCEGVPLLDPRTMNPTLQQLFYEDYLPKFERVVQNFAVPDTALLALAWRVQGANLPSPRRRLASGTAIHRRTA